MPIESIYDLLKNPFERSLKKINTILIIYL